MKIIFKNYINYLRSNPNGLWFKRKLYGWGWTPVKWQGWIVVLMSILIFIFFWIDLMSGKNILIDTGIIIIDFFVLLFICYKKGEKPRWQWGPEKNNNQN